jgi:hypothetical protein
VTSKKHTPEPPEQHTPEQIAHPDQVARVSSARLDGGPGDGMRIIDIAMTGGMSMRLLPDRGLDIGATWCASSNGRLVPLSWQSKVGETAPLPQPTGSDWVHHFGGGLVTTCGVDNVGPASEGIGLHGTYSHRRATDVHINRVLNGLEATVTVSATVDDTHALSRHIRIHRTITTVTGKQWVRIDDTIENLGPEVEPIPILYHCNFGFPFWSDGSTVHFSTGSIAVPRDKDAAANTDTTTFPGTGRGWPERVYEQIIATDANGPLAQIVSPQTGLTASLTWSRQSLPRCIQWIHPGAGVSALGVEPTNSSVLGRAAARAEGRLPMLAPGERETTWVEISVAPTNP